TVRNLTLTRARVPDNNGAGIRGEGANLLVDGVRFINNQNGILAGTEGATIIVRNSYFERNGTCQGACAHGIYIGHAKLLRVENSKFFDTREGHHIKSRAERTEVVGCTLDDGEDGTASYMVEAPNGGSLIVRDSTLTKGPQAGNHTGAIVIGTEGVTQPTREITITNNTFRNAGDYPTSFVWNLTATDAVLTGNRISGKAKPLQGDGKVTR
ncbi:MAG: right-handed parallel beta-helix repeat-containing protein, partial [Janthinobacterium lividum]